MPSNPTTSPEERRMITFDAIAPDGTRERLRFETQAEADAAADQYRETGHSLYWIAWSESLQRFVTEWASSSVVGSVSEIGNRLPASGSCQPMDQVAPTKGSGRRSGSQFSNRHSALASPPTSSWCTTMSSSVSSTDSH
jgi:hypothetical protein